MAKNGVVRGVCVGGGRGTKGPLSGPLQIESAYRSAGRYGNNKQFFSAYLNDKKYTVNCAEHNLG